MIISDLCDEYAVLVSQNRAPAYGYDNVNAPYGLVVDDDGTLIRVRPLGDFSGKKPVNIIPVPARFPRSSGIVANFLCDNVTYLLGCDTKGNAKRAAQAFQACGELHRRILDGVKDRAASAVCAFFSKAPQWQIAQRLMGDEAWKSSVTMNFALEYDDGGQTIFIGELPSIREAWDAYYGRVDDADESALVSSLVSGERIVPEKVHPKIKGVAGAQSSGASLISFNAPAFCSHGTEQNENAPMSKRESYEYTTALNTLLADRDRVQRIGGDTVVSWANCGDNVYRDVWDQYMGQSGGLSEKVVVDATRALAQGKPYDYEEIHLSPDEQFHILALSPNAARLSVRFYLTDTFGAFARNIDRHYRDIAIRRPSYDSTTFLPTWRLLNQTIRTQSKTAKASPQMAGAVMKAILEGTPYPMTLINAVERRINAEHDVSPDKAAIIKAYYLRATTNAQFKEVLRMDINEESDYLPYVLGRMFSVYEQIQLAAIPGINTTIKDKYFTSASTTPARIFPILGDLAAKHMRKAWKSKGLKVKLDKALGELTGRVGDRYPSRLSLEERGAFQLGYYFENQKRFDKTNKNNNEQGENND